jgi:hypothetical protein
MDQDERWILEAAIELKLRLRDLIGAKLQERLNRPHHGLDAAGVASVLQRLIRKGYIALFRGVEEELTEGRDPLLWLAEHGDDDGDDDGPRRGTAYGLTLSGGVAWEGVAHPNWSRFIDASFGCDPFEAEVICADPIRLNEYVFSKYQVFRPIPESLRRDRLEPWPATYWKMLPLGHRFRFAYDPAQEINRVCSSGLLHERYSWLKDANGWFTPSTT